MMERSTAELTDVEREILLDLARAAIADALLGDGRVGRMLAQLPLSDALSRRCGLFVTLTAPDGALRGCIGTMRSERPLYEEIPATARSAAFQDPRFTPLTRAELDGVRIQLSILTPPEPTEDWRRIEVGLDGVQLERGRSRAVFLPHVATDQGWDLDRLLRQLARKAGLAPEGWRGARLSTFRALSFSDAARFHSGG